jgi:hypothetical protein
MKWNNDEYSDLKWKIFELVRKELFVEHAKKLTIKEFAQAIDDFFEACKKENG